jgi:hypothetical protein
MEATEEHLEQRVSTLEKAMACGNGGCASCLTCKAAAWKEAEATARAARPRPPTTFGRWAGLLIMARPPLRAALRSARRCCRRHHRH